MKYRNGNVDNDAIKEQISAFESALDSGDYVYVDVEEVLDMLGYYLDNSQTKKATELLDYALKLHPDDTDLLIERAYICLDENDIQGAKKYAKRITEANNSDVILLNMELALNEGRLDMAEEILNGLNPMDRQSRKVVMSIADIYNAMGYTDYALNWLKTIEDTCSSNKGYKFLMAEILKAKNEFDKASELYNSLIDDDPYNVNAWLGIAQCHFAMEQYNDAIEACEYAIAANENFAPAYSILANAYMQLENYEKAESYFKDAIAHNGMAQDIGHAMLGICYCQEEKHEEACKELEYALSIMKEDSGIELFIDDVHINYAVSLNETGQREKALEMIEPVLVNDPQNIPANIIALRILIESDYDDETVTAAMHRTFKLVVDEGNVDDTVEMVDILMENGMKEQAVGLIAIFMAREGYIQEVLPKVAIGSLNAGDIDSFYVYNHLADEKMEPMEAYNTYMDSAEKFGFKQLSFEEFTKQLNEAEKKFDDGYFDHITRIFK